MSERQPKLKPQHAPKPPHEDLEFLQSTPARPLRILAEYLQPMMQLKKENIGDTIVMFGSARIESRETALSRLTRLKNRKVTKLRDGALAKHRLALKGAKSALEMSRYYEEARQLSHKITAWASSLGPKPRRFVICSGGGPGIMEAANRGAYDAGGKSIGLSIELPHEQFSNAYISPELSLNFHYFFMRKLWFAQIAKALIVFPGGFGTMDELWEMMTLLQTCLLYTSIVAKAVPVYYITGTIHSPETGAPTALMELAYRLAVDESPYLREVRDGMITLITPVVEVDGRDRCLLYTSRCV